MTNVRMEFLALCVYLSVSTFAAPMFVSMHAQAKVNYSITTLLSRLLIGGVSKKLHFSVHMASFAYTIQPFCVIAATVSLFLQHQRLLMLLRWLTVAMHVEYESV